MLGGTESDENAVSIRSAVMASGQAVGGESRAQGQRLRSGRDAAPSPADRKVLQGLPRSDQQRLGVDVFQRFFEQVVDLCQETGLVWGRELYFDATKVEANAGIPSLIPHFYYDASAHVADLFADEADDAAAQADIDPPFGAGGRTGDAR